MPGKARSAVLVPITRVIVAPVMALVLASCSTVERRTYFTPAGDAGTIEGPAKPFCGWVNFGGRPDRVTVAGGDDNIAFEAYQDNTVYLIGPWFAAVLPVFPISWLVEWLFLSDDVKVQVYGAGDLFSNLRPADVTLLVPDASGAPRRVAASEIWVRAVFPQITRLTFPVDANTTDGFRLEVNGVPDESAVLSIPFSKASRWSYTQESLNC